MVLSHPLEGESAGENKLIWAEISGADYNGSWEPLLHFQEFYESVVNIAITKNKILKYILNLPLNWLH